MLLLEEDVAGPGAAGPQDHGQDQEGVPQLEEAHGDDQEEQEEAPAPQLPYVADNNRRYPVRERRRPAEWFKAVVANSTDELHEPEPQSFDEAKSSKAADKWEQAMNEEKQAHAENQTWIYDDLPPGAKAIDCKWVFKEKKDAKGNLERHKARVAKGFQQTAGVDFDEVYAQVSKSASLRTLLSIVAKEELELHHLDVKIAFLNGDLEELIYMKQPPGYHQGGPNTVCRLRKALYGLRQAPRAWHTKLKAELESMGFQASKADPGFWILKQKHTTTYVLVYVDDVVILVIA
jgi:hypothetical protein